MIAMTAGGLALRLRPLVEQCVRRYRDRRLTFMIVNSFGGENKSLFRDGPSPPAVMCVTVGSVLWC